MKKNNKPRAASWDEETERMLRFLAEYVGIRKAASKTLVRGTRLANRSEVLRDLIRGAYQQVKQEQQGAR